MKKLKKSFIISRIKRIKIFPPSWHIQNVFDEDFFYSLDMRLCKLTCIEKELYLLTSSTTRLNLMLNTSSGAALVQEDNEEKNINLPDTELLLKLDVSINELTFLKYSDFTHFSNLRHVDASFNSIADISGLAACSYLSHIILSYNVIRSLNKSVMQNLRYVVYLDLRSNLIRDLSELPSLPSLFYLNLSYNLLETLDGLHALFALQELYVQHNQIKSIVGLSACMAVQKLNLSNNRLDDPRPVVSTLNHLSELFDFDIRDNNFTDDIFKHLQNNAKIKVFNGKFVGHFSEGLDKFYMNSSFFESAEDLRSEVKKQALEEINKRKEEIENDRSEKLKYLHCKILSLNEEVENELQKNEEKFSKWSVYVDGLSEEELTILVRHGLNNDALEYPNLLTERKTAISKKKNLDSGPQETGKLLSKVAGVLSKENFK